MLKKVPHINWAALIVVVDKKEGGILICGDYEVASNGQLLVDQYSLLKPDDILATLEGGE